MDAFGKVAQLGGAVCKPFCLILVMVMLVRFQKPEYADASNPRGRHALGGTLAGSACPYLVFAACDPEALRWPAMDCCPATSPVTYSIIRCEAGTHRLGGVSSPLRRAECE